MSPKETAYIVERLAVRFISMVADYERKLAEHRASFGARTEADRLIIEGLRVDLDKVRAIVKEQSDHAKDAGTLLGWAPNESAFQAAQRVVKERDALLTQLQDMRAEIERLRNDERKAYQDGDALRVERDALRAEVAQHQKEHAGDQQAIVGLLSERDKLRAEVSAFRAEVADLRGIVDMVHSSLGIKRGDHIGNAIAELKSQTSKRSHPVKVGEWVRNRDGGLAQVLEVHKDWYLVARGHGWPFANCEPCDPPVDHDTHAGKASAESAAEIKLGDVVEVFQATGKHTSPNSIGFIGTVGDIHNNDTNAHIQFVLTPRSVSICDVRKVTT